MKIDTGHSFLKKIGFGILTLWDKGAMFAAEDWLSPLDSQRAKPYKA